MSVRRSGPLVLAAVLAAAACNKSVSQRAPAPTIVLATFDPGEPGVRAATIPLPSDLALRAAPAQTGLTREVLFSYISGDGFPGDQTITVPIRSESYDATSGTYAPAASPPAGIDATTVNAQTVAIVKIDDPALPVFVPQLAAYGVDPANPASGVLRIRSVTGLPVGRYVVAVRGGDHGVKTADGLPLGPDQAIALIAPNKDLTQPENQPPVPLTPEQITALEQLRALFAHGLDWGRVSPSATCHAADPQLPATIPEDECWLPPAAPSAGVTAPFQAIDKVFPHHQLATIQTFEVSAPAVVADTSAGVLPFPSDFLLGANGKVRNVPSFGAAAPGLALLDGFSTTSLDLVPVSAPIDPATVAGNVHFYELGAGAPRQLVPVGGTGTPEYLLVPPPDQTTPATFIGLQPAVPIPNGDSIVPLPPLKPKTKYLVVVTDGVKDPQGHALVPGSLGRLLLTVSTRLTDTEGHSNIPGVSDADAAGLQLLRDALRNQLLPAVSGTLGGKQPVMAYTITTQDVKTTSASLTALPYSHAEFAATTEVAAFDPTPVLPLDLPFTHVKRFLSAKVSSVDVLDPTTGGLDPTLPTWTTQFQTNQHELPVLVAVPRLDPSCTSAAPCPAPLVVFHHGIFGSRFQMLGVADALAAKGFVVVATDAPFHGDRAFCKQTSECNGGTCQLDPANQRAPGTCVGGNGLAYNPTRLSTYASGNYFISPNFFRLRDALREDLVDQSALILAAAPPPGGPANAMATELATDGVAVDPRAIYFAGASLGGMIGTSAVATNPRIARAGFTVAGGTMVDIFTQAPAFQGDIATLFSQLIPGFTPAKVTPGPEYDPVIAQKYVQTLILAKWIIDPVEPVNWAADVTTKAAANSTLVSALGPLAVSGADVYGQLIQGDPVVPNPFNLLLYEQNGDIETTLYTTTMDPTSRHGVLILPGAAGDVVRGDLANFLFDGTVPATPVVALPVP